MRFRPRMVQWRVLVYFDKLVSVNKELLDSANVPIFMQFKLGEQIIQFQISNNKGQFELI